MQIDKIKRVFDSFLYAPLIYRIINSIRHMIRQYFTREITHTVIKEYFTQWFNSIKIYQKFSNGIIKH